MQIKNSGEIIIENGAYLCVESGATINLQDFNSAINLGETAVLGNSPNATSSATCISSITNISKTGSGTINRLNQSVYIQNETITENRYIAGKNIYVGSNVTSSKPQGNVIIVNGANVMFRAAENVYFEAGFDCNIGGTFEVIKQ